MRKKRLTQEKFIMKAMNVHGEKYNYSLVVIDGASIKIPILCSSHGIFYQKPSDHLQGYGCIDCGGKRKKTTNEFIKQAKNIHKEKYEYKNSNYKSNKIKIEIFCVSCQKSFLQTPDAHLRGQGCHFCKEKKKGFELFNEAKTTFLEKIIKLHGKLYDYTHTIYAGSQKRIIVKCNNCNKLFKITPNNHLKGEGCNFCSGGPISKSETRWLNSLNILEENRQYPIKINNKTYKVDGFCSKTNTIYEFLGDYWHGNPKKFNQEKINLCNKKSFGELYQETINRIELFEKNGYKVVYIWENDYQKIKNKGK